MDIKIIHWNINGGFLLQNNMYANHLCTVVDNHNEIINGKYTHEPAILLLHMSPDVRKKKLS